MTAFLFLQKFDGGVPAKLPYGPLMARLSRVGVLGRGMGDLEVALPADVMAATCTVIGGAEDGIACIGFERPRFDDKLRALVWDCMQEFDCAVFDDTLDTVYSTPGGRADLPAGLLAACRPGARQVSSAQQLWPADFEVGVPGPGRPALRYPNANPDAADLQLFDTGAGGQDLCIEIGMRAQACNPGTLRVLRNVQLRVDAALGANPEHTVLYRYSEYETSMLLLESAKVGELAGRATSASPPPGQDRGDGFVADRAIFASEDGQTDQFTKYARDKYALAFDAGMPGIEALAGLLDQAHAAYRAERERLGGGAAFSSTMATAWARMAGGYLGHFIAQQIGAQWGYITRAQQRVLVLRTHGGRICCPHHLVLDHIINGAADSIVRPIAALMRAEASSTPRGEDLVCQLPVLCEQLRGERSFDGGSDLPFVHLLARDKLDFSVQSLTWLDQYLAQLALRRGELSDQALTDAILGAGAYLGETIRSNTADPGHWQWLTYEQAARRDPEFAQSRPREISLLAILDSDAQMAYPFAHVAAIILEGRASGTALAYARQLGVGGAAPRQDRPPSRPQAEPESPEERAARHAEWSWQARQDEQLVDRAAFGVNLTVIVLIMLVLAYTAKFSLDAFFTFAVQVGIVEKLLYGAWIIGPSLCLAAYSFKTTRSFLPLAAMLASSIFLLFFAVGVYGTSLTSKAAAGNMTVFLWVPLAQFVWTGGWMLLVMRQYIDED
jgi:hypothetical protein